jgi:hypothetical protein
LPIRLLQRFPWLRRIPGRAVGLGIRRERVRSPASSGSPFADRLGPASIEIRTGPPASQTSKVDRPPGAKWTFSPNIGASVTR